MPCAAPRPPCPPCRRGLTLIELLIGIAIAAVLAALSYPAYQSAILTLRRGEALTLLAQCQLAQERHRSNHPAFATLAQLGIPTLSPSGRYLLSETPPGPGGYSLHATAQGAQAADARCRHLRLQVEGLQTTWASGPDSTVGNTDRDNRRCWGR
ncbi:MAG: type IV pilin protein [Rubrivivax sp.]|nr:type IV pilin protein [Rubrivivax sp.]